MSEQEEFIVKKIIIASIALLAAGALPAAAQTVNWNGSFGGASGAGSAVTGGFAFGAGSTAAGQAATTGWAEGKGTVGRAWRQDGPLRRKRRYWFGLFHFRLRRSDCGHGAVGNRVFRWQLSGHRLWHHLWWVVRQH
ncbi:hypothetical protein AB664_22155 [Brucella anthropi]|uniref:Uncharacterized protein n=1 Tax=Brucella anthropi TaxID=529 RepID=A0A656Z6L2_BRUAN|nr:hypothetical protein AB664_22155 [Brucella anthropi]